MTRIFSRFSVRTKLFLSSLIITMASLLVVGLYLFNQRQQSVDFLITEMLNAARTNAERQLAAQVAGEATLISAALESVKADVSKSADYAALLLDQASVLGTGTYWDAAQRLTQLNLKQWGNAKDEPGSVYLPPGNTLTPERIKVLNALRYLDFSLPNLLAANPEIVGMYFIDTGGGTIYYPNIDLATTVGDFDPTTQPFYTSATPENNPDKKAVWTTPYQDPAGTGLIVTVSKPVYDSAGQFRGVMGADVLLSKISQGVNRVKAGDTGYAFLIDEAGRVISMPDRGYTDFDLAPQTVLPNDTLQQTVLYKGDVTLQDATDKMRRGGSGVAQFQTLDEVEHYIGYTKVTGANYSLGLVVPVAETTTQAVSAIQTLSEQTRQSTSTALVLVVIILIVAGVIAYITANTLTRPLQQLTLTATEVAGGNLAAIAPVMTSDEIGTLAVSFNNMTAQLRSLVGSLEDRIQARTEQLRASADVGRTAASVLQPDELLRSVVNLITDRFGFYYAAVFLIDSSGRHAVLHEATGEAGRILKERGHQLEVNSQSMVGYAIARRRPRIALDVGADAVRFANPLLPETRSEIALPLIVGDKVLGALDVQSTQEAAFDESNAAVLQSMTDQIAVALSNAEQFVETNQALSRAEILSSSILDLVAADSIQEVIQHMVHYANTLVAANRTAGYIVDLEYQQVLAQAVAGDASDLEKLSYEALNSGISGLVFQSGRPVLSLSADDGIEPAETRARRKQYGTGALIVVPLVAQNKVIGTVTTSNRIGQRLFTQQDVDLLMTLAAQSASTIEKQQSLEQTKRALSELDTVNRQLTGTGWEGFARQRSQRDFIWVSRSDQLQPQALPEVAEAFARGRVATRRLDDNGQLSVAVPIQLRDVPIGTLRLIVPAQAWNTELAASLESIAGHVAQAAENARLISQSEDRLTRERALTDATEKVRQQNDIDAILEAAATELARYLNASHIAVRLDPQVTQPGDNGHAAQG